MMIRSIAVAGRHRGVPEGTITAQATTTECDQPLVADAPAVRKNQRAQLALGQCTQCRAIERRVGSETLHDAVDHILGQPGWKLTLEIGERTADGIDA